MKLIICICGPTAVGKTKLSIELAKKYNAEIINYDSVQIYKGMDIASAKVTPEEKEGIVHHLIDIKEYDKDYSVYDYQIDARNKIKELEEKGKNIIFVGGTGLYLKATLFDYKFQSDEEVPDINLDNKELLYAINEMDPDSKVDPNNRRRLIREYINLKSGVDNKKGNNLLYKNVYFIGLETPRDILYDRINKRVDIMLKNGLLEEAKYFFKKKKTKSVMTPIGYKELFKYFTNEISLEEATDLIKKNSRHYAKRQFTFFKNQFNIKWFETNYEDFSKTVNEVINYIEGEKLNGKNRK
ncbi:MAG: tRNA (adenosine(37)-N6)-dimethylallyltransferase MiaA [Bacilli bacterium]|nr:tRNA (adenosine(37)-N6)-dimethylallyltransferase MiaA [Bacilli bacterium]